MSNCGSRPKKMKKGGEAKKPGFGQGSGSNLVDANIAANPIKNLPAALKVELNKYLKSIGKEDGGPAAPIMPEKAKEIRKKKRKERNASREQTRMPSKKMREAMAKGYAGGGEAFPDLTGDGKVTRKDILKGRGVKGFEAGGAVCRGMGSAMRGGKFSGVR